jgi:hypothetical protein
MMANVQHEPVPMELKPEGIASSDPVLKGLSKAQISPILVGLIYTLGFLLIRVLAAWRAGHLWTVDKVTGILQDPGLYTNLIILAIVTYYVWMPRGIAAAFNGLHGNGVVGDPRPTSSQQNNPQQTYPAFIKETQTLFGGWWWPVVSLVIAISTTLTLNLPQYQAFRRSAAWAADTLSLILTLLWVAVAVYCVTLLLIYSMLSIYRLNALFNSFAIRVRPLHPDRAGGLAPLGNFTLTLSYLIPFVGILLVLTPITRNYVAMGTLQYRWSPEILVALIIYIIAAPAVFFAPLSVAHNVMNEAKNQLLLQIARRFEMEYHSVQNKLDGELSGLKDDLKTLEELQSLHDTTSKFPVWPFNAANMRRFGTSYISPIILALVIDLITNLLNL